MQVNADGTIVLGEYFGGFDGFFSTDPADGHENCFNTAVVDAFGLPKCETEEVQKTVWVRCGAVLVVLQCYSSWSVG